MKIGIITFWTSEDNYGQMLQCYALQKYLRNRGHEVFLIRYSYEFEKNQIEMIKSVYKVFNIKKLLTYLSNKKNKKLTEYEQNKNTRYFAEFKKNYIIQSPKEYKNVKSLIKDYPEADAYIVGSDQVWNPKYIGSQKCLNKTVKAYFLAFGTKKTKRLSYAASWGVSSINENYKKMVVNLLNQFDYISVREESGVDLCKQCSTKNVEWVCDPTFLLNSTDYRSIYQNEQVRKVTEPYILLYMLNNQCNFEISFVYEFAKQRKLKVIYVTGNGVIDNYEKYFATVPEWLYLVDNAEYVITNSFHCCVFSTLFNKKYAVVPLSGTSSGMNLRFESLFSLCKIENRFIDDNFSVLEKSYIPVLPKTSRKFIEVLEENI